MEPSSGRPVDYQVRVYVHAVLEPTIYNNYFLR